MKREHKRIVEEKESVRKTTELLDTVFNGMLSMIAYMDCEFNFIRVNRAYADANGSPPEDFVGKNHFAMFPHRENQRIFEEVVRTGEPYRVFEKPFSYPDQPEKDTTYWDWTLVPVHSPDDEIIGLVLTLVDVTVRIEAREALRQAEESKKSISDDRDRTEQARIRLFDERDRTHGRICRCERSACLLPAIPAHPAFPAG